MVFVDTSVWIDFLGNRASPQVDCLLASLEKEDTIYFTGLILQEIFQGVASARTRKAIEESFLPFVEIFPTRSTYLLAAELFRKSRAKGHPIRSSVDCLIAACCVEHKLPLLEKDRDFKYVEEVSALNRIHSV
jgi:predicted nucleic acid-binding protein